MIVHSTENFTNGTCVVKVEWDLWDHGTPEKNIVTFACGAAAAHNRGMDAVSARLTDYTYWDGTAQVVIPEGWDTSDATGAIVTIGIDGILGRD